MKNEAEVLFTIVKMSDLDPAKEARRRKLRQLEASLFTQDPGLDSSVITGLPELQRVDEYADRFGQAEKKKKGSALPALKVGFKMVRF